jgi:GntR family transcriptional regulator
MSIDYDSPVPPYRQIAGFIRARIESGELADGARLPSITQLMQTYGIARTTAVKAMKVLADAGLAEIVPGWGSYAKAPPPG